MALCGYMDDTVQHAYELRPHTRQNTLPTRLLDVGNDSVYLVLAADLNPEETRYAALSYC